MNIHNIYNWTISWQISCCYVDITWQKALIDSYLKPKHCPEFKKKTTSALSPTHRMTANRPRTNFLKGHWRRQEIICKFAKSFSSDRTRLSNDFCRNLKTLFFFEKRRNLLKMTPCHRTESKVFFHVSPLSEVLSVLFYRANALRPDIESSVCLIAWDVQNIRDEVHLSHSA